VSDCNGKPAYRHANATHRQAGATCAMAGVLGKGTPKKVFLSYATFNFSHDHLTHAILPDQFQNYFIYQ
jgi:hypothetical protein